LASRKQELTAQVNSLSEELNNVKQELDAEKNVRELVTIMSAVWSGKTVELFP